MNIRLLFLLTAFATALYAENTYNYMYYKACIDLKPVDGLVAYDSDFEVNKQFSAGKVVRKAANWSIVDRSEVSGDSSPGSAIPSGIYSSRVFKNASDTEMIVGSNIVVNFDAGLSFAEVRSIIKDAGLEIVDRVFEKKNCFICSSSCIDSDSVLTLANGLAMADDVIFCEPEMFVSGHSDSLVYPDDNRCWALHNDGTVYGIEDADMDIPEAWEYTQGSGDIIVVVLDCGISLSHPDLNVSYAKDFTYDAGDGGVFNSSLDLHGTMVAGCVAAKLNGSGTTGVAPGCSLASARVLQAQSDGSWTTSFFWIASALHWAETIGARVTVNSNSFNSTSSIVDMAYQHAYDNGIINFASAGNNGTSGISYPSSLDTVNSVAASTYNNGLASFSSYGDGLAFTAPGYKIYTTIVGGGYSLVYGTSFSCPCAGGVAALVLSVDDTLSPAEVAAIMQSSATDLGASGYDTTFGYGLVNAYHAVVLADTGACKPADINRDHIVDLQDYAAIQLAYSNSIPDSTSADLDCSGSVTINDLFLLSGQWLTTD